MSSPAAASRTALLLRSLVGLSPGRNTELRAYEADFASFFGPGLHAVAFDRGRTAMTALLTAAGLRAGDEVILSAYTCHSVPAALSAAGLRPVLVDIDPVNFGPAVAAVERAVTPRSRALVIQHSYGWPADVDALIPPARNRGLTVIEDCCQSLGTRRGGVWLGTLADGAFFSMQWNKHYSTAFGGMALLRNEGIAGDLRFRRDAAAAPPSLPARQLLAAELLAFEMLMYPRSAALLTTLYRKISGGTSLPGGSEGVEGAAGSATAHPAQGEVEGNVPQAGVSALQAALGRWEVARLAENIARRRDAAKHITSTLRGQGHAVVAEPPNVEVSPLRLPVRIADPLDAIARARCHGFELTTWFDVPTDPLNGFRNDPHYAAGSCPLAEQAARSVVLIPLGRRITSAVQGRIERFFAGYPRAGPAGAI